ISHPPACSPEKPIRRRLFINFQPDNRRNKHMAFNGSRLLVIRRAILLMAIGLFGGLASLDAQNTMTILADQPKNTISRHIYGQFSEHLGTGMYGGLWVGEDSGIPNTDGFRNDVVKALRELEIPNIRWPGG